MRPSANLHAPQDQLVVRRRDRCRRADARAGCSLAELEDRGHLALLGAFAHQRRFAARAEREREGIEQDRFAGAGLAGQRREAGAEIDVEPVDQDDVADGEPGEHGDAADSESIVRERTPDDIRDSQMAYDIGRDTRHRASRRRQPVADRRQPSRAS